MNNKTAIFHPTGGIQTKIALGVHNPGQKEANTKT